MFKWLTGLKDKVVTNLKNVDKDQALKWSCIIGAGILGVVGNIFDNRSKDREARSALMEAARDRVSRISLDIGKENEDV